MWFLTTDTFGFLCLDNNSLSEKKFTITAGWQTWEQQDHRMITIHKWHIKEQSRKDLGNTMQLIRLIPNRIKEINENTDMSDWFIDSMYSILERYEWYDEVSNTSYNYIPKLSGNKLLAKLDALDLFAEWWWTTILNEQKWWFSVHKKSHSEPSQDFILAEFFGLCFLFGKATLQKNILSSYKIQVPVQHYTIQNKIDTIIEKLRSYGFVLNVISHETQHICEITTNDYMLLAYIRILLGEQTEAILIDKVLEIQKEIYIQYGITPEQQSMRWQIYEVKR